MAEELEDEAADLELDEDGQPKKKKKKLSGKVLVLFILLPLLVIGGGVGGAFFAGLFDTPEPTEEEIAAAEAAKHKNIVFYDLPEMLVNLSSGSSSGSFLKLGISLELEDEATVHDLELVMPRILDNFQVYLRELRKEDLNGSQGVFRLKEELLMRINSSSSPIKVNDVLFKEMLVQ